MIANPNFETYRQRDRRVWQEEITEYIRKADEEREALKGKRILEEVLH